MSQGKQAASRSWKRHENGFSLRASQVGAALLTSSSACPPVPRTMRSYVYVCVCVCVCEREKEKERERTGFDGRKTKMKPPSSGCYSASMWWRGRGLNRLAVTVHHHHRRCNSSSVPKHVGLQILYC